MNEPDAMSSEAEWAELCETLMRGMVHAFNNRIAAMSASIQLVAMGDDDVTPDEVLPAELAQFEQTTAHLRALCAEKRPAEAFEIIPVIREAIALHGYHPRLRDIRCEMPQTPDLVPVRMPRWALSRLLLVLIGHAKRASQGAGRDSFVLQLSGDDRFLDVRLQADDEESLSAQSLAALCGATIERANGETLLRLPSLLEVRRIERAARDAAHS
jgi:hypothetical protein